MVVFVWHWITPCEKETAEPTECYSKCPAFAVLQLAVAIVETATLLAGSRAGSNWRQQLRLTYG